MLTIWVWSISHSSSISFGIFVESYVNHANIYFKAVLEPRNNWIFLRDAYVMSRWGANACWITMKVRRRTQIVIFMGPTCGQPGSSLPQVAPCWPLEPCYQGRSWYWEWDCTLHFIIIVFISSYHRNHIYKNSTRSYKSFRIAVQCTFYQYTESETRFLSKHQSSAAPIGVSMTAHISSNYPASAPTQVRSLLDSCKHRPRCHVMDKSMLAN